MSRLYLDAYSGISGDMFLGAMLALDVSQQELDRELSKIPIDEWEIEVQNAEQSGVRGLRLITRDTSGKPQTTRHLSDIREILQASPLDQQVIADAVAVFELLARAEAKVHSTSIEEVHFHEVGAVDAILDIVGACICMHWLGACEFGCSPLPLGNGFVRTSHGMLPVPAPATVEILNGCGAPVLLGQGEGEMVTPTGAALVAHFGRFDSPSPASIERVGYGFGTRKLPWPNALRAILTSEDRPSAYDTDTVTLIECNLDDMAPEVLPYVIEQLLARGALDAWTTPIGMKKGRPAIMLSALTTQGNEGPLVDCLLRETSTLGVRYSRMDRHKAQRRVETVRTPYGPVRVKLKLLGAEIIDAKPEYEDCAQLARESGAPFRTVYDAARQATVDSDRSRK